MDITTYREAISNQTIFEKQNSSMLSSQIFEAGPGIVSPEGAMIHQLASAGAGLLHPTVSIWVESVFGGIINIKPLVNGYALEKAVQAENKAMGLTVENQEEKKKGLSRFF